MKRFGYKQVNKQGCWPILAGILVLLVSCTPEHRTVPSEAYVAIKIPDHFPPPLYDMKNNPPTAQKVALGRKLFYDPILSKDGTISCGSCHQQNAGFADLGKKFSLGVDGKKGMRNSPALSNLAWMPAFMADGGINHIEIMPVAPITDSLEMDQPLSVLVKKLSEHNEYQKLFKAAFNADTIDDQKILLALAQFMSTIISASSKYDQVQLGQEVFTEKELNGYQLFKTNCSSCHKEPLLSDYSYSNNGLDKIAKDPGRARITQNPSDRGKFKVPTLRNVELTAPYMHDGRFENLMQVVEHYNKGIHSSSNLDARLPMAMNLSQTEKEDLVSFLKTLTDHTFLSNSELSEP